MTTEQPPVLTNSRRRYDKVTYTPLLTKTGTTPAQGNALALAALVRALAIRQPEADELAKRVNGGPTAAAAKAIAGLVAAPSGPLALRAAAVLATVDTAALATTASSLAELRHETADRITEALTRLTEAHSRTAAAYQAEATAVIEPAPSAPPAAAPLAGAMASEAPLPNRTPPPPEPGTAATSASAPADILAWAATEAAGQLATLRGLTGAYLPSDAGHAEIVEIVADLRQAGQLSAVFADGLTRMPLEPFGLLHLERLVMTPMGVERGELVYSLPLAPKEKVTLAHREWTTRTEEFQRYVQDSLENFSEQGVAEADDIAMSSSSQSRHANELSVGTLPTSTSGATLTSPVDATSVPSAVDDTTSKQESKGHSREVTAKASARTIRDQKISFTVTTVSGVEDFTARVLENPATDRSLRIDYYRRMRRWRTELYRYGVRMTYDVVLPDPGKRLRGRQVELAGIEAKLEQPFQLPVQPGDITPASWSLYAAAYGVALPPPPEQAQRIETTRAVGYNPPIITTETPGMTWTKSHFVEELQLGIPAGTRLSSLHTDFEASTWINGVGAQWITVIAGGFVQTVDAGTSGYVTGSFDLPVHNLPTTGTVAVEYKLKAIQAGQLVLIATVVPTDTTMNAWRLQCWTLLRDKAYTDYLTERDRLRERRTALQRSIADIDALTLRKLEREQIMLAVLEWLFPGFDQASDVLTGADTPGSLPPDAWRKVMEYGEYIKFVHSAIDWDNVMVLLYPHFWDAPAKAAQKLWLSHPDSLHREFLRAGAAKLVLAIRPGFEDQVVSLLDKGQLGQIDKDAIAAKIATQVRAANATYAKTTLPSGTGSDDPREPGVLLGTWFDSTPSPALDIDVATSQVARDD